MKSFQGRDGYRGNNITVIKRRHSPRWRGAARTERAKVATPQPSNEGTIHTVAGPGSLRVSLKT